MASLIQMFCPDCDYTSDILRFGPTWSDQRNLGPAFDSESLQVVEVDYDTHEDTRVVPYTNRQLQRKAADAAHDDITLYSAALGRQYALKKNHNFCPGCNSYTLKIDVFGIAD
ncbi:MAG TPA: hypothetical protein VGE66_13655 [Chitinophagaceae bacterium]